MEKFILRTLLTVACLSVLACGPAAKVEGGVDPLIYETGTFTQQDSSGIAGTGTLRFANSLPSLTSAASMELTGAINNTGSITAVFYSDSQSISVGNRGIRVVLQRATNGATSGYINVNGLPVGIASSRLSYIQGSALSVIIEVHNTPQNSQVIIWRKDSVSYALADAEVNSANPAHLTGTYPATGGLGLFAGLQLSDAALTTAILGSPKLAY